MKMDEKVDIRAGYRVPDGYFGDFSARMAAMVSADNARRRRASFMRRVAVAASSVAAVAVIALGIAVSGNDAESRLVSVPSDVFVTKYLGATESEVIDYYYLPVSDGNDQQSISDDDILDYLSSSGSVNLYSLLENQ